MGRTQLASGFAGSNWSRGCGKYLLGCQTRHPVVWDLEMGGSNSPALEWPSAKDYARYHQGAFYSRFYGASWCPWTEGIFLTTTGQKSVVAIDVSSGSVIADMTGNMCHSSCVIECHNTRPEVVVANSVGPGYLASFKFSSDNTD